MSIDKAIKDIGDKYRANTKKLLETVGTKEHAKYVKIERKLSQKELVLLKKSGKYIPDPCPVNSAVNCSYCVGYYRLKKIKGNNMFVFCRSHHKGAIKCSLKDSAGRIKELLAKVGSL